MADSKLTGLTEITAVASADLLYIVDDPGGTPAEKKVPISKVVKLSFDTAPTLAGDLNVDSFGLDDTNGNELLKFSATASAVNEITVKNAATGNAPELQASGGDTDIDVKLTPKGAGDIVLGNFTLDADQSVERKSVV